MVAMLQWVVVIATLSTPYAMRDMKQTKSDELQVGALVKSPVKPITETPSIVGEPLLKESAANHTNSPSLSGKWQPLAQYRSTTCAAMCLYNMLNIYNADEGEWISRFDAFQILFPRQMKRHRAKRSTAADWVDMGASKEDIVVTLQNLGFEAEPASLGPITPFGVDDGSHFHFMLLDDILDGGHWILAVNRDRYAIDAPKKIDGDKVGAWVIIDPWVKGYSLKPEDRQPPVTREKVDAYPPCVVAPVPLSMYECRTMGSPHLISSGGNLSYMVLETIAVRPPAPPTSFDVTFSVTCPDTKLGEEVYITGNLPELGDWIPNEGLPLNTDADSFPIWTSSTRLPTGKDIEFKAVIVQGSTRKWELEQHGSNRKMRVDSVDGAVEIKFTFDSMCETSC